MTSFKHKLDKYLENIPDKPKIPGYTIKMDTNSITSMRNSRGSLSNTAEAESPTWLERLYSQTNQLSIFTTFSIRVLNLYFFLANHNQTLHQIN